jgi:hypothetical protein
VNNNGLLGSSAASDGKTPVRVRALPVAAVGIWADQGISPCALLKDGSVWCWGITEISYVMPVASPPTPKTGFSAPVRALTTGGELGMSCALLTTGAVQCWGHAFAFLGDGNLGEGGTGGGTRDSAQPVDVLPAGSGAVEIRSNDTDACALLANGSVTCWGQLSVPTTLAGP